MKRSSSSHALALSENESPEVVHAPPEEIRSGINNVMDGVLEEVSESSSDASSKRDDAQLRVQEDAFLVAGVQRGDLRAARSFHARIEPAVNRTLAKVLGRGDHEFEDIAQLALERIVLSITRGQYGGRCNLATWASVITSRVAIDHLRRRRHERRLFWFKKDEEDAEFEVPAKDDTRPDQRLDAHSKLAALRESLAKLSPEKAETVVLFEVMGHDLPEIAEMTGVSVSAAQSRLVRGRKELSNMLRRRIGGPDGS